MMEKMYNELLNAYTKDYDLGQIAQKHRQTGSELWRIREKYLDLLTDLRIGDSDLGAYRERREKLADDLHAIYAGAPSTDSKAYQEAQKALKVNEDMTFSDNEIDAFLPKELKAAGFVPAAFVLEWVKKTKSMFTD